MNVCPSCYKIIIPFVVFLVCFILQCAICLHDNRTLLDTKFQVNHSLHKKVAAANINPNYVTSVSNQASMKRLKRDYWRPRFSRNLPRLQSKGGNMNAGETKGRKKRGSWFWYIYTSKTERIPSKPRIPSRMKYNKFTYPTTLGALFLEFTKGYETPWANPMRPAFYTEAYRQLLRWGQRIMSFASGNINFMKTTQLNEVSDKFLINTLPKWFQRLVFYIPKREWDAYEAPATGMNVIPEPASMAIMRRRKANITFHPIQPKWGRRRPIT